MGSGPALPFLALLAIVQCDSRTNKMFDPAQSLRTKWAMCGERIGNCQVRAGAV
jgi:hypothetical protein